MRARTLEKVVKGGTYLKKFVATSAVGLVAIVAANLTTRSLCVIFREPYRLTVARTAIAQLDLIDQLPAIDRANYLRRLQADASDPITKEAIPAIAGCQRLLGRLDARARTSDSKPRRKTYRQKTPRQGRSLSSRDMHSRPTITLFRQSLSLKIRDTIIRSLASSDANRSPSNIFTRTRPITL